MDARDIQKAFKAGAWNSPADVDVWVLAAGQVPVVELQKLLGMVADKSSTTDANGHRHRNTAFRKLVEANPDQALFVPLVRAFKAADSTTRQVICDLLPKVNQVAGHAELVGLLESPDIAVRKPIVALCKQLAGKNIFDAACLLAKKEHPGRTEAIDLAGTVGAYHSIGVLGVVLTNGKPEHRVQALKLLGDAKLMTKDTGAALEVVGRVLRDPSDQIQSQAVASYSALCSDDQFHENVVPLVDGSSPTVLRAALEGARRFDTPRTHIFLETRFRMGPNAARLAILGTLEVFGNDATLPLLTEALSSKHIQVTTRAGEVLRNLAAAKKVNLARTLMWLLRSRDVNVRRLAVDLAKRVGDATGELWPSLLRFLRDEDWWVRERVTDALVEMAGTQLTRFIVGYLGESSDVIRRYAVDVLLRLKDPQALGALVRVLQNDPDWWVRERAMEAIAATGDPRSVPYVVDVMFRVPELQVAALEALGTLGSPEPGAHVASLLGSPDTDVKLAALKCLVTVGQADLAPTVEPLLQDKELRVRTAARSLLERWRVRVEALDTGNADPFGFAPLDRLLVYLARAEGDDLLIGAARPPYMKRHGKVTPIGGQPVFSSEDVRALLEPHLTDAQRHELEQRRDIDFSHEVKAERLRFRANVFREQVGLAAVFRIVKNELRTPEQLGLPPVVQTFGELKNGLVLVGGPTGSGKSTTLAALIDHVNRTRARHIVTLEDPIEVVHQKKMSLVNQREIGTHTNSFQSALRSVLREDPDVLLVGEMRDLATISFAVTAAETGHLVFGTLHTVSADTTVDRLVNAFPSGQQAQVRSMLAESLRAVVCQHLLRRKDRPGRTLAVEVMVNNDAVSNLIRKGKAFQLPSIIATSRDQGMQAMDADLKRLVKDGIVHADEAYMKANSKKDFEEFLQAQGAPPPAGALAARPPGAGGPDAPAGHTLPVPPGAGLPRPPATGTAHLPSGLPSPRPPTTTPPTRK